MFLFQWRLNWGLKLCFTALDAVLLGFEISGMTKQRGPNLGYWLLRSLYQFLNFQSIHIKLSLFRSKAQLGYFFFHLVKIDLHLLEVPVKGTLLIFTLKSRKGEKKKKTRTSRALIPRPLITNRYAITTERPRQLLSLKLWKAYHPLERMISLPKSLRVI